MEDSWYRKISCLQTERNEFVYSRYMRIVKNFFIFLQTKEILTASIKHKYK